MRLCAVPPDPWPRNSQKYHRANRPRTIYYWWEYHDRLKQSLANHKITIFVLRTGVDLKVGWFFDAWEPLFGTDPTNSWIRENGSIFFPWACWRKASKRKLAGSSLLSLNNKSDRYNGTVSNSSTFSLISTTQPSAEYSLSSFSCWEFVDSEGILNSPVLPSNVFPSEFY